MIAAAAWGALVFKLSLGAVSHAWLACSLLAGGTAEMPDPEAAASTAGRVAVRVEGIRHPGGLLQLSLFASAEGYPEEFRKAARTISVAAAESTVTAHFDSVPPGAWALAVLHDADGDGRLDRNALGVPREGIGASRDAVRRLGPPRFRDARFIFPGDSLALRVRLRYW